MLNVIQSGDRVVRRRRIFGGDICQCHCHQFCFRILPFCLTHLRTKSIKCVQ